MSNFLINKLQSRLSNLRNRLSARWHFLRQGDVPGRLLTHDGNDTEKHTDAAHTLPARAPDTGFSDTLIKTAARDNTGLIARGETHERSLSADIYLVSHRREYLVYTPVDYQPGESLPLVVVLHGCHQTHQDIRAISGFDAIADRERFIVVYPFVTGYFGPRTLNCWGWWMQAHIRAGSGEAEDLRRIIESVKTEFNTDTQRTHITGLSSGAGMTVAALVAHGDLFASGASVAGLAYGETARAVRINSYVSVKYKKLSASVKRMRAQLQNSGRLAPLLVIQSEGDKVVEPQAAINLRDSWLKISGITDTNVPTIKSSDRDIDWQYQQYSSTQPASNGGVDVLTIEHLPHGWVGGHPGTFSDLRGPNISEVIWLFFKRHH